MVHDTRLMSSSLMTVILYTIVLLSICQVCMMQEDISHNLVRDTVELGNPYSSFKGTNYGSVVKRKHPNHSRRRQQATNQQSVSAQITSTSTEEASSPVIDRNVVREVNRSGKTHRNQHNNEEKARNNQQQQYSASAESSAETCPMCAAAQNNARLDEDTLRALRIEMVKQEILKKLRLKEPPKMEHVPQGHVVLPPIALGNQVLSNTVRNEQEDVANLDLEDFYGKTEQIIVLPQDKLQNCGTRGSMPLSEATSCFVFNLPKEVKASQISSAELWVYKLGEVVDDEMVDGTTHNFSISEIVFHPTSRNRRPAVHLITTRDNIPESSGWINFNITERARKWLVTETDEHTVKISCSTCGKESHEFPFDIEGEQQPFVVFNIANGKRKRRSRRSINCKPGVKECCRESLYISFEEIEWGWVYEPKGFDAYYCKGKCHGDTAIAHTATQHSGVMIDYVKTQGGLNNKTVELIPCCTATEMSAISLIYLESDRQSPNATTYKKVTIPNMVVEKCGCK